MDTTGSSSAATNRDGDAVSAPLVHKDHRLCFEWAHRRHRKPQGHLSGFMGPNLDRKRLLHTGAAVVASTIHTEPDDPSALRAVVAHEYPDFKFRTDRPIAQFNQGV